MLLTMRYVGSGETGLTLNNDYVIVGFSGNSGYLVDDNGNLYLSQESMRNQAQWQLVSVQSLSEVQIAP